MRREPTKLGWEPVKENGKREVWTSCPPYPPIPFLIMGKLIHFPELESDLSAKAALARVSWASFFKVAVMG